MWFAESRLAALSDFTRDADPFSVLTVIVVPEGALKDGRWKSLLPSGLRERLETALKRRKEPLGDGSRLCVTGRSAREEDCWLVVLPQKPAAFPLLELARDTLKDALQQWNARLRLVLLWGGPLLAEAMGAALAGRVFPMPVYGKKLKEQKPWELREVEILAAEQGEEALKAFHYGYTVGEGTNLARSLATIPANFLNPKGYGEKIRELAEQNGLGLRFYGKSELKKMGAGAFTAVDQGNPESSGGIYELSYGPPGPPPSKKGKPSGSKASSKALKCIHVVGKGICYDTGGYDVKTGGNMVTMKGDMQGSAVALATIVTAARLGLALRMKAYLAVTENHISPHSFKADDVVIALNGLSIEVVNSDAEGRMVLADTLTLSSRQKPDCVLDFATLTGAAVRAIGTRYAAGFTNRDELHEPIRRAGDRSGERIWTFPIDASFSKSLESKVADTLQCTRSGPDHILAACFLSRFVEEGVPWVHLDLAASENEGGLGAVDSLFTGFGVRWALEFINAFTPGS